MADPISLSLNTSETLFLTVLQQGPAGVDGADGTGDLSYVHTQAVPASTWIVIHALGKRPAVTVVDSAGTVVIGDVAYDSDNQVTLTFNGAFSGAAYFN